MSPSLDVSFGFVVFGDVCVVSVNQCFVHDTVLHVALPDDKKESLSLLLATNYYLK